MRPNESKTHPGSNPGAVAKTVKNMILTLEVIDSNVLTYRNVFSDCYIYDEHGSFMSHETDDTRIPDVVNYYFAGKGIIRVYRKLFEVEFDFARRKIRRLQNDLSIIL